MTSPTTANASERGAGAAREERPWRRGRRVSLLLLPPTLLAALWMTAGDSWRHYRRTHDKEVVAAPAGQTLEYGGSDWRLRSLVVVPSGAAGPIPAGTALLHVELEVVARDAAAVERLSRCQVALTDERGRRWTRAERAAAGAGAHPSNCDGDHRRRPQAGVWFRFEQRFIVPAAVAGQVEPMIALAKDEPGRVLRLRRR